ncbi:tetratricopeptide repeat protein [Maricaulis sp. CAU 1757]
MIVRHSLVALFGLVATAPGLSQVLPEDAVSEPDSLAFPTELVRLPDSVQQAAGDGLDPAEAAVPTGMSASEEAWYRAQIAYLGENWDVALGYAETAAAAGEIDAALLAGLLASDARRGRYDLAAAVRWFRRAAEQDQPVALYQLGLLARLDDDNLELGLPRRWFERAARAGHVGGMLAFAGELKASPVPQDHIAARSWAERAAQRGSAEGMFLTAQMLDAGQGGERDAAGARLWYERAGRANLAEAAFQAGMMWAGGEGGEADDDVARTWLRQAAESGYGPAQGQLGLMIYQGRGGAADPVEAAHWFGQGARGGDPESQFLRAFVLARGEGVEQDLETAYFWTLAAAQDIDGEPRLDPDRDQLQAALERALTPEQRAAVRERLAAAR